MAALVSTFITQTLCDHQGRLDFRQLESEVARRFTVDSSVLRSVLLDGQRVSIRAGGQTVPGDRVLSPDSLLVAKTALRVCQRKVGECSDCDSLHLCRYFICGNCSFGDKCRNSHIVYSEYNAERLRKHNLHGLKDKQLFQLLLQNDPYLLPEICPHYNKGDGLHGSCKFTTSCTKLHVCRHHFQGDCAFGSTCKRVHQVDGHEMKALQAFSPENIRNLPQIYANRFIITGQQEGQAVPALPPPRGSPARSLVVSKTMSDDDKDEICMFSISGRCSFKERCVRVHWALPYRWQVQRSCTDTWEDFPFAEQEGIERAYSEPGNDTIRRFFTGDIHFVTMTSSGAPVRRLSTASSASKSPHFTFTTRWLWYWKDDRGKWAEFGQSGCSGQASPSSLTLEGLYLADREAFSFSVGSHQYILTFKDAAGTQQMYQQNIKSKTKREGFGLELYHSTNTPTSSSAPSHSSSSSTTFPSNWDRNALPEFGYKLVPLESTESDRITELFQKTLPRSRIKSIQRIQNPSLWKVFQWQKEQMKQRNGGAEVREDHLFHGTDDSLIEAICEQNFDWRVCGVHGTAYGKGSYFARDAVISDKYTRLKKSTNLTMFVARVLVGEFTRGRTTYMRPPAKANSKHLYDSCVDNVSNPSIFVIFEKQQIYPEYIINYV